jgi:thiopeptide-type bacteriocin biosynthesis protein
MSTAFPDDPLSPSSGLSYPDDDGEWLSAYVFYDGDTYDAHSDRVILDVAEPVQRRALSEGWADRVFFIRYSEHGPHVRLRFHGDPETLVETVAPALEETTREALPTSLWGRPRNEAESEKAGHSEEKNDAEEAHADLPIRYVPYQRETDRYGGPEAVRLAERFFHHSSLASFDFIRESDGKGHSARLGKGLLAMVVKVYVFVDGDRTDGARFMNQYRTGYLNAISGGQDKWKSNYRKAFDAGFDRQAETLKTYVDAVWSRMDAGESLSDTLDPFHRDMLTVRDAFRDLFEQGVIEKNGSVLDDNWLNAVRRIVPSYVHMTNNRLGVPIPEESYLAHCVGHALDPDQMDLPTAAQHSESAE